jgi:hypothetical protein
MPFASHYNGTAGFLPTPTICAESSGGVSEAAPPKANRCRGFSLLRPTRTRVETR